MKDIQADKSEYCDDHRVELWEDKELNFHQALTDQINAQMGQQIYAPRAIFQQ